MGSWTNWLNTSRRTKAAIHWCVVLWFIINLKQSTHLKMVTVESVDCSSHCVFLDGLSSRCPGCISATILIAISLNTLSDCSKSVLMGSGTNGLSFVWRAPSRNLHPQFLDATC